MARASSTGNASNATTALATRTAPKRTTQPAVTADYVAALREFGELLYKGGLGPKDAARPETVAAIVQVGRDLGIPATMALANVGIVNGRPCIFGDLGLALIRSSGLLESIEERYEGEPGTLDYTAVCVVKRVDAKQPRTARFSFGDAQRAKLLGKKGPWTDYPERMLMWRARSWACRDEFQDVLCGLGFVEEANDHPHPSQQSVPAGTVVSVTTDTPTATATATTAAGQVEGTATAPATTALTADQQSRLSELRGMLLASKGLANATRADQAAVWAEVLAPFNVTSALMLTTGQAADLIARLEAEHDPFAGGKGQAGTATT